MVDPLFMNNLDMGGFEILNAALQNLSSPPQTTKTGLICFVTTDGTIRYWNGTTWAIVADMATLQSLLAGKVDKVDGKGLSTNDFTDELLSKLNGIAAGAEVNVNADWNAQSGDSQILNKPTLGTAASRNVGTGEGNVPILDSSGKLPDSTIPPLAIGEYKGAVSTKADLVTLSTAQQGDIAQVTADSTVNNNGVYWLNGTYSTLDSWIQIVGPGSVISVNGKSGVVVITAGDVDAIPTDEKGAASGVATLGADTKVPIAQIPTGNADNTVPMLGGAATQGQTLAFDSASGKYVPSTPSQYQPYTDTITGDGATVDFTKAHGLGRRGIVQVTDAQGNGVYVAYTIDTTNVTLHFGAAPASGMTYNLVVG